MHPQLLHLFQCFLTNETFNIMLGENREVSISCLILPSENVEDVEDVGDTFPGKISSGSSQIIENRLLKVQSRKLHNNKYMIVSPQITNAEIFAFISVLVFKLLGRKVLFINRKDNRNC